ncbi:MAG: ABC transporter ATP-binding protein [Microcoleus sp. PH2017_29_MFU_D_A]|uniref:ABC transporter ATP-binding protein n=1 Tax=unclassified Microcoleus TaxID=2642155 RepID=UPI001E048EAC|nr:MULTISPECIES: ABC transporter ATP-binding protein [unclassified Microcoleus]MCC3511260.1 ABC transporter ATP-binding protein [Microcoleus sp. PH2017_17_BER_D_A]TAE07642.1 MAG: ABC transporter ATP-binding protein [Oscillatoriales cyanobacterium]MCC3584506.1 ABC transporter ATP-binding protein [Microcoleus sp. PH2017_30_WIL_O_A]MCC3606615.1 ABC transporter ATP-binding protein [Microcoleus sp. PH2017_29_MFU_D_A]MCC3637662.1 ABC transporter ATP-binding protein [Microcoleus sp. PH2017_37_MFU_D_B
MKARSTYWQILPYLRPQKQTIGKALACTVVFTIFWPIIAWLVGETAKFIGKGDLKGFAQIAALSAIIFLIRGIAQYGQDTLMAKAALTIALEIRKKVYAHLQNLNLGYFETAKTGDLSYRLTEDIDRIGEVVNKFFHQFIPCVLQLIAVMGYMIYLNWQLTLGALIIAPLMAILIGWFGEKLLSYSRESQNRISDLSALLTEVFSGIRLIKAFVAEDYEIARFAEEAEQNRRAKYLSERIKALQFVVVGFLEAMSVILLFFLGGWQIAQGNLTGTQFISYIAGVALLIDPIAITTANYGDFKQGEASSDRIFELLAIQSTVVEKPGAIELPHVTGKVEYRNINFAYPPQPPLDKGGLGGVPILQSMSLLALPGEAIALVGASGAGKTTLVNLLPRFYDPQAGQILIDGIDIQDVTLNTLRRQIGIVPQETILFSGTIAQNIAFGQSYYELKDVQKAAEIANAHQFITEFPDGYQTWVGERGVNLSGGQKQRIAIARAVLLNPRILILDEATSALDSESEALVQEALERLMRDRTVFIIAHRLATVRKADRILVLEKGRVMESGTHEELLQKGDRYARYYAQQFSQ